MSISQISVFVESKPGHLKSVLDILTREQINIRGYCASDTGDYGIVRFVVDETDLALDVLSREGFAVKKTEILCAELRDEPGELGRIFNSISRAGINIAYSYSLVSTYIAFRPYGELALAEAALIDSDLKLVNDNELHLA